MAKYIPGNIFQYGARQLAGAEYSIPQISMMRASVVELAAIISIALLSIPFGLYGYYAAEYSLPNTGLIITAMIVPLTIVGALMLLKGASRRIFIGYGIHVFLSNFAFLGVFATLAGPPDSWQSALTIAYSFTISWLLGVLTPGAPAGLGVREAALLILLAKFSSPPELLGVVLISRIVTSMGDFVFFAVWGRPKLRSGIASGK